MPSPSPAASRVLLGCYHLPSLPWPVPSPCSFQHQLDPASPLIPPLLVQELRAVALEYVDRLRASALIQVRNAQLPSPWLTRFLVIPCLADFNCRQPGGSMWLGKRLQSCAQRGQSCSIWRNSLRLLHQLRWVFLSWHLKTGAAGTQGPDAPRMRPRVPFLHAFAPQTAGCRLAFLFVHVHKQSRQKPPQQLTGLVLLGRPSRQPG